MDIKYIGFYDVVNSESDRVCNLAAMKKMDYIAESLTRLDYNVEMISPSWMGKKTKKKFERKSTRTVNKNIKLTLCPSWQTKHKITEKIKIIYSLFWLFQYLIINAKKGEKILVYHVEWFSYPIRIAKFIKRFELILEVEEIYSRVWDKSKLLEKMEKKLINIADNYIFVSEELQSLFNIDESKSLVLYGAFKSMEINECYKKDENCINLVYAGSIDDIKGGAFKSLDIIEGLKDGYKLHILGGGPEEKVIKLTKRIEEINKAKNKEVCIYTGILHGQEFDDYLSSCDIALNPQNMGDYMQTAFPSKVISYLGHHLLVLSTPIKSIVKSMVRDKIIFTMNDKASSFINVIDNINLSSISNKDNIIKELDKKFLKDFKKMLDS
ncbi:glycosyltransferase family protein [Staphylococcus equorum]|uniref:glycosyltransferase n=1 Tax=Staphylococcus equorum TaxID=246432 RepID=UPI0020CDDA57|nr:glycosyltransferase [Staphylococcus equorum]MEB7715534.1 glycosyltransferase [Staphylococcus equorum]MEB7759889.1 glycosyltransferase [Staphylococcus equorum]MEB7762364.1 glycosyltransferase [Staphylococcus equorum]MEB7793470.1 glycosyltransferase [Staphylococcus equorum]UTT55866.1 glycosyltransferase [Staphylococcus equorum]